MTPRRWANSVGLTGLLLAAVIMPTPAGDATPADSLTRLVTSTASAKHKPCVTSRKRIAKDLRREAAYPIVDGVRARDVTACRGRWAVVTMPGLGDTSFNTRFRKGHWRFNAGYPSNCDGQPAWLCPMHP